MLVVPRLQRSTILAIRLPALPGWAEIWLPALRAWVRFAVHYRLSHALSDLGLRLAIPVRQLRAGSTGLNLERAVVTYSFNPDYDSCIPLPKLY